jgi:hypothetical protein
MFEDDQIDLLFFPLEVERNKSLEKGNFRRCFGALAWDAEQNLRNTNWRRPARSLKTACPQAVGKIRREDTPAPSYGLSGDRDNSSAKRKVLMLYQPAAHLLGHDRLTRHRHLAHPLAIHPHSELTLPPEGQIDQFHSKAGVALVVLNHHGIMRFGTGQDPLYLFKRLTASLILSTLVHAKVSSRAYRPRSNSS